MRKNSTNLTVDGSIVERVKALKSKAGEPYSGFSVTRCVELLLGEVLAGLETKSAACSFSFYRKFLEAIHGERREVEISDEELEQVAGGAGRAKLSFGVQNEINLGDPPKENMKTLIHSIVEKVLDERFAEIDKKRADFLDRKKAQIEMMKAAEFESRAAEEPAQYMLGTQRPKKATPKPNK